MLPALPTVLVAGTPDAMLVNDANGRYQDANTAACTLLGYARDELLHLRVQDVIPEDATCLAADWAGYYEQGSWHGRVSLRRKDGMRVAMEAWSVMLPGPE